MYLYTLNNNLSLIYKNWKLHWSLTEAQGFKKYLKASGAFPIVSPEI